MAFGEALNYGPLNFRAALHALRIAAKRPAQGTARAAGFNAHESRTFSQNGEDGLLAHVFAQIGFESRTFVEFGFSPAECNGLWLARQEGFGGLWIDADGANCAIATRMARFLGWKRVRVHQSYIHKDNINDIIKSGLQTNEKSIDLLSVDIDGMDYWVLQQITCVRPRVLVVEYNATFGPSRAISVAYRPEFSRFDFHRDGLYFGASLKAFQKLGVALGYRLVGTDTSGTNAFFLDNQISADGLPTQTVDECWRPMAYWTNKGRTMDEKFAEIEALPFVEV